MSSQKCPETISPIAVFGPQIIRVSGNYGELVYKCQKLVNESRVHFTYGDTPFRREAQKTIANEICEQLDFNPPDFIVLPVSSGGNISAIVKGLEDMKRAEVIDDIPGVVGVQAEGAAPIANPFQTGEKNVQKWNTTNTLAHAISNPYPSSGNRVIKKLRSIKEP